MLYWLALPPAFGLFFYLVLCQISRVPILACTLAIYKWMETFIDRLKELGIDARSGVLLCMGRDLRIVYICPSLAAWIGSPRYVSDLLVPSMREKHRQIVARYTSRHQALPDSLQHPMRNVPILGRDREEKASLIAGRVGFLCPFFNLFYIVLAPADSHGRHGSTDSQIGASAFSRCLSHALDNCQSHGLEASPPRRGGSLDCPREPRPGPTSQSLSRRSSLSTSIVSNSRRPSLPVSSFPDSSLQGSLCVPSREENPSGDSSDTHHEGHHEDPLNNLHTQMTDVIIDELVEVYGVSAASRVFRGEVPAAERYTQATALCCDIVDFTRLCATNSLDEVSSWMTRIHNEIDLLLTKYSIRKVETRGDCCICVTGTNFLNAQEKISSDLACDQVTRMVKFAEELCRNLRAQHTEVRIGIATGSLVLTHISHTADTLPAKYIYGDTVNVACRMEQTGTAGFIQLHEFAAKLYVEEQNAPPPEFGIKDVKGKGLMKVALYDCFKSKFVAA